MLNIIAENCTKLIKCSCWSSLTNRANSLGKYLSLSVLTNCLSKCSRTERAEKYATTERQIEATTDLYKSGRRIRPKRNRKPDKQDTKFSGTRAASADVCVWVRGCVCALVDINNWSNRIWSDTRCECASVAMRCVCSFMRPPLQRGIKNCLLAGAIELNGNSVCICE